ncbi:histidine phosphatase family protein [Pseudomaricurvus alkylphenolicus]|jgi:alpha-ribazole phosphatase|uniref:histidine phosphatase family protein n=1 Tax=Pseudomaricurvus alkylphenolicus TaxID=1306991 RepID=UPI0014231862|nr:histidine phosphatase family protein [Pseudomaricurvus alkylphenolicus]NIB39974.1 histidine phosphatase family protein [Pseudomaricurvus alkylphenolicus]
MTYSFTGFDLLRHGECTDGSIFRGHTDSALSPQGWQQMVTAVDSARQHPAFESWDVIVSSPLQRCQTFAQHLAEKLALPLDIETDLQEIFFGHWEGRNIVDIEQQDPTTLALFWRTPDKVTIPGAESLQDFHTRIEQCFARLQQQFRHRQCLLITHGGVIRSLLGSALGMPLSHLPRLAVAHAGFSQLRIHHQQGEPDWVQLQQHITAWPSETRSE